MKIVVLSGSPHRKGTTSILVDSFINGATATNNEIFRVDTAFQDVHFCTGCEYCQKNNALCVQKDYMVELTPYILEANAVIFATPLYSFGFSSQLKVVIERFYPIMEQIKGKKQSALLASSYDNEIWTMDALVLHYQTLLKYLNWENKGIVLARGCGTRNDIEQTDYPNSAYILGKSF